MSRIIGKKLSENWSENELRTLCRDLDADEWAYGLRQFNQRMHRDYGRTDWVLAEKEYGLEGAAVTIRQYAQGLYFAKVSRARREIFQQKRTDDSRRFSGAFSQDSGAILYGFWLVFLGFFLGYFWAIFWGFF